MSCSREPGTLRFRDPEGMGLELAVTDYQPGFAVPDERGAEAAAAIISPMRR